MNSLLECYRILGVSVGAGIADVTSSYKRLCRAHHPDVSSDPESEELMKRINIAYTALREKLRRESILRERQSYARAARKYDDPAATYATTDNRQSYARAARKYGSAETRQYAPDSRVAGNEAERAAFSVVQSYFKAISSFDFTGAYTYLSNYDKKFITRESFVEWRKSVARVFTIREFKIAGGMSVATVNFNDGKTMYARRFRVSVMEEDFAKGATRSDDVEKLVVCENGFWKVFLGYSGVGELTRAFDERYEVKLKRDVAKRWEEYYTGLCPEYNMLSLAGMRKEASREIYRQKRFGGALTFAVISVQAGSLRGSGYEEVLRSAAKTMTVALRETDIPAYAGDGVFAILFVELRKKNAEAIISRLVEKIRKNAGLQLGARANMEQTFDTWSGSGSADIDALNKILRRYCKKM